MSLLGSERLKAKGTPTVPPQPPPPPPPLRSILGLGRWQANGRASSPVTPHPGTRKTLEKEASRGTQGSWFIWHITEHQACSLGSDHSCRFETIKQQPGSDRKNKTTFGQSHWISSSWRRLKAKSSVTPISSSAWVLSVKSNDLSSL